MRKPITVSASRLKEALTYNEETGVFIWKLRLSLNVPPGTVAGKVNAKGYRYIRIDGEEYLAQRLAWFWVTGDWPEKRVCFVDKNPGNCAFINLRLGFSVEPKFDYNTKEGKAAYGKAHRAANPELHKEHDLKKRFGISLDEYSQKLLAQNGRCAICKQPETNTRGGKIKALAVDHCHTTSGIRDLLCQSCNMMIGHSRESPEIMMEAAKYLQRHAMKSERQTE